MTPTGKAIAELVSGLTQHRRGMAAFRSLQAGDNTGVQGMGMPPEAVEAVSQGYLQLARHVLQVDLQKATVPSERAQGEYGMALIGLSERVAAISIAAGIELAKAGSVGRDYLRSLLTEPDVPNPLRTRWETALAEHEQPGFEV